MKIKTNKILLALSGLLFISSLFISCSSPSSADTPDKNAETENTSDGTTTINVTNENIVATIATLTGNCNIVATGDFSDEELITSLNDAIKNRHNQISSFYVSLDLSWVTGLTCNANMFSYCSGLKSITLPDGVTSIGQYAFQNCEDLISISIPDGVTSIEPYTFYFCEKLTSVNIPNGATRIGNEAFYCCYDLTSITIPNSVSDIGFQAFYTCEKLTTINLPNSLTRIENDVFAWCWGLTSITIPANVVIIERDAFRECSHLENITFTDSSSKWNLVKVDYETGVIPDSEITDIAVNTPATNAANLTDVEKYLQYRWTKQTQQTGD